jgi:hypothetical protein
MPAAPVVLAFAAGSGVAAAIGTTVAAAIGASTLSSLAITAIGTGVLAGGMTAIQGGDVGDVLKSAIVGGVSSYAGGYIGSKVTDFVSQATNTGLAGGVAGGTGITAGPGASAYMGTGAVAGAGSGLGSGLSASAGAGAGAGIVTGAGAGAALGAGVAPTFAGTLAGNVVGNTVRTAIQGGELKEGIIGGIAATIPTALNASPDFAKANPMVKSAITASIQTALTGGDVDEAVVNALLTSGNLVAKAINEVPGGTEFLQENPKSAQFVLNGITSGMAAALTGKDVNESMQASVMRTATTMIKNEIKNTYREQEAKAANEAYIKSAEYEKKIGEAAERVNGIVNNPKYQSALQQYQQVAQTVESYANSFNGYKSMYDHYFSMAQEAEKRGDKQSMDYYVSYARYYADFANAEAKAYESYQPALREAEIALSRTGFYNEYNNAKGDYDRLQAQYKEVVGRVESLAEKMVADSKSLFDRANTVSGLILSTTPEGVLGAEMSKSQGAVDAYLNALALGATAEQASTAAQNAYVAEYRAAKFDPNYKGDYKPGDGIPVASWNQQIKEIKPEPLREVYRAEDGDVYVYFKDSGRTVRLSETLGNVVGSLTGSAGDLMNNFVGAAQMMGFVDPNSPLAKMGREIEEKGDLMMSENIQKGKSDIIKRVDAAEGWDKITEIIKAGWDNLPAATAYVMKELPQEFLLIGAAGKIAKVAGMYAGLAADAGLNGLEAGGAAYTEARNEAKKAGKSDEEAHRIGLDAGLTGLAISAVAGPALDYPFIKGMARNTPDLVGKTPSEIASIVRDTATKAKEAGKAAGKEFGAEGFEEGAVAGLTDFLVTGSVDWNSVFTQATVGGAIGAKTAGTVSSTTGSTANVMSVLDPGGRESTIADINSILESAADPRAAATQISSQLQQSGMSEVQANAIANTAVAESIVNQANANASGSFQIGDLNQVVGVDTTGNAVTLGDAIGSSYTGLNSSIVLNPGAKVGTDVDGSALFVGDVTNFGGSPTTSGSTTATGNATTANPVGDTSTGTTNTGTTTTGVTTDTGTTTGTTTDTTTGTTVDTGTTTGTTTDTTTDTTVDTTPDTNVDTTPDTNVDTTPDTNVDTSPDTNIDTNPPGEPPAGAGGGEPGATATTAPRTSSSSTTSALASMLGFGALGAAASGGDWKNTMPEETWLGGMFRQTPDTTAGFKRLLGEEAEAQEANVYSALQRASGVAPDNLAVPSYYSYGKETSPADTFKFYRRGGTVQDDPPSDKMPMSPLLMSHGDIPHKGSHYVDGAGGGQDDLIPAQLADGEYVLDAEIVAALGDGSSKEGAKRLDKFREAIRKHKRGGSLKDIPPKAKSPLAYFRSVK